MIAPTVGSVVGYYPSNYDRSCVECGDPKDKALAAEIVHLGFDRLVNLRVTGVTGITFWRTSVPLVQDGEPLPHYAYCEWMPHQKTDSIKSGVPPVTSAPISGGASASSPQAPVPHGGFLVAKIEAKHADIQAELLKTPYTSDRFTMLYSAQQALGWAVAGMKCPIEMAIGWTNGDGSFIKPDEPAAKVCGDVDRLNTAARALYDLNPIVEEYGCSCGACDAEFTRFGWDTALELGLVDDYFEQAHAVLEAIAA